MKAYVLSVSGMAILTTMISLISPGEKYKKMIAGVLKLCMLSVLITPVFRFFLNKTTNFFETSGIYEQDVAYINNSYETAFEKYISDKFGVTVKAEIAIDEDLHFESVKIYVLDFGMSEGNEHINIMSKIESDVKNLSGCNETEVVPYG